MKIIFILALTAIPYFSYADQAKCFLEADISHRALFESREYRSSYYMSTNENHYTFNWKDFSGSSFSVDELKTLDQLTETSYFFKGYASIDYSYDSYVTYSSLIVVDKKNCSLKFKKIYQETDYPSQS